MASLTIIHKDQALLDEIKKLEGYIQSELNVKEIKYSTEEDKFINLYAKPNLPVLGKRLGKEMGKYMGLIKSLSSEDVAKIEETGSITLNGQEFTSDDFLIFREAKEGTEALSNRFISIDMDTKLNDDLIKEGLAREVVNRIQRTRKDSGFNVEDRIKAAFNASAKLKEAIETHREYIMKETLCEELNYNDSQMDHEFKVDDEELAIKLSK
tara:strand:+ start:35 stop:667 length:633 start_codon:yes stop_codon:yes gene_type:complete